MQAIIMAGGEGERLRPLTCDCPKPMARVCGRPVMEYALRLLKAHGVTAAGVTLKYLPEAIRAHFGDGREWGVDLTYFQEKRPLGTAGGVAQAREFLTDTFCVLSGDGLTDCDLTAALASHRASGAQATIVLTRVEDPREYGLVERDGAGRVTRFVEKPQWSQVTGDAANAGIYILEPSVLVRIPAGQFCDFGRDVFPGMLRDGEAINTYLWEGYWCDIGDLEAYRRANGDVLAGRLRLPGLPAPGALRHPSSRVDPSARLEAPCWIGEDARVAARAFVGAYSVVGPGACVGENASVKRSVLLDGARVGAACEVRGAVLLENARMEDGSRAFEGSVLGKGAALGAGGTLDADCRVWPGKRLSPGSRYTGSVVWGGCREDTLRSGRFRLEAPEDACRLAAAWYKAAKPGSVLLARGPSAASQSCALALQAELLAQGVQVYDAGVCAVPEARFALWSIGPEGGAHVSFEDGVRLWDGRGAELDGGTRRKLLGHMRRGDGERPFARLLRPAAAAGRCDLAYIARLSEGCAADGALAAVYSQESRLLALAEAAFGRAGCRVRGEWEEEMMEMAPGEVGLWLEDSGESVRFLDENGALTEGENQLLRLWVMLEEGFDRLIVPHSCTRAAEELARERGAEVVRVCGEKSQWMNALLGQGKEAFMYHFDGLYLGLRAICRLREAGLTLAEWRKAAPSLCRRSRLVRLGKTGRARAMGEMMASLPGGGLDETLSWRTQDGWAWVCPSDERSECRVVAESTREEVARDLCDSLCAALEAAARHAGEGS